MRDLTNLTLLDRYQLKSELGRGGMGTVYRGRDLVLKRDVAVKLLSATGLGTEGKARMLREAQSAAGLAERGGDVWEDRTYPRFYLLRDLKKEIIK